MTYPDNSNGRDAGSTTPLRRKKRAPKDLIWDEAVLLIGLLYHGTKQHDALIMRNIFKDGLERAHKIHTLARKL